MHIILTILPQCCLCAYFAQDLKSFLVYLESLRGCSYSDDLHHLFLWIGKGSNYQQPVEEVTRDTVRGHHVFCTWKIKMYFALYFWSWNKSFAQGYTVKSTTNLKESAHKIWKLAREMLILHIFPCLQKQSFIVSKIFLPYALKRCWKERHVFAFEILQTLPRQLRGDSTCFTSLWVRSCKHFHSFSSCKSSQVYKSGEFSVEAVHLSNRIGIVW